jgi:hypothetical protein
MRRPERDCAPAVVSAGARGTTRNARDRILAWVGKRFAILLYAYGLRSLTQTQAAFARHPEWWDA